MSTPIITYDSKLYYGTNGTTNMTNVRIKSFPAVDSPRSTVEVTDMSDDARTYVPGIRETPSDGFPFDANYDPTVYSAIKTLEAAGNDLDFKFELSDGSNWTWTGRISVALKEGAVNSAVEMTIKSTPSTAPAFNG